jgi:hypothetical protein
MVKTIVHLLLLIINLLLKKRIPTQNTPGSHLNGSTLDEGDQSAGISKIGFFH